MTEEKSLNFIEQIIEEDLQNGLPQDKLRFRFPPEPNGYLHIGHAASICLNFGLGRKYNAPVNLRFDDTNPAAEEQEYVDAIKNDIAWLGFEWDKELYASNYFQQLYDWATEMIKQGKAYVDEQSQELINEQKGTPTQAGIESPYRNRPVEESLDLLERMNAGEFEEGTMVLRAKIDMASPNMHMRDPIMYRILHRKHHRTGDKWKIYPMYDWTHGQSDYLEQVSHSICTLEFKSHRPLYEWFIEQIYSGGLKPKQREFARRNLSYTVMSKRKLMQLVNEGHVDGWDDPRMPTISGLRRRGYTPESIINFSEVSGISKRENVTDVALLEYSVREHLNKIALRRMAVLRPLKMIITNYPEGQTEWFDVVNNPEDESAGTRKVPFSREILIEASDFMKEPPKKFFRLGPGRSVRLKNAYKVTCDSYKTGDDGEVVEIYCTYHPDSKSGQPDTSNVKVKSTIHWVNAADAVDIEIRLYDRLFADEAPDSHKDKDFMEFLNPDSLHILNGVGEINLKNAKKEDRFQFLRMGYFIQDKYSSDEKLIFNRTVTLKDAWKKIQAKK